jgi:predicted nucleic acid-binding protein
MLEFAEGEPVLVTPALILDATAIHRDHSISWWDSTLVAAALHAESDVLYSEDLQHHRGFDGLQIVNPFFSGVHETPRPYPARRKK